jgi:hypothetical protein
MLRRKAVALATGNCHEIVGLRSAAIRIKLKMNKWASPHKTADENLPAYESALVSKEQRKEMAHERRKQKAREYHRKNRERLLERKRKHYQENRYSLCYKTLNLYCFKSMERIQHSYSDRVDKYINDYPFEKYAERQIKRELGKHQIYSSHGMYSDCYDAGMLAYLYSIHRCAAMRYDYAASYIIKMIRIYIICAIVIYYESRNLCKLNGFREIPLNAVEGDKF